MEIAEIFNNSISSANARFSGLSNSNPSSVLSRA